MRRLSYHRMAAAGIGALALGGAAVWWVGNSTAEHSLAEIYSDSRTLELRIPGAAHAPLRAAPQLRSAGKSRGPSALLLAEGRIARETERHPASLRWRQLGARAALLRGDYDFALAELERIQLQAHDASAAMPDLAIAYFERAESLARPADYAEALEQFAGELRKHPDEAETLFNCGVVYQKLQLPLDAQRVWERYLRVDPAGGWAGEVRARLTEVKAQLRRLDSPVPDSDEILLAGADYGSVSPVQAQETNRRHGDRFLEDLIGAVHPAQALDALAAAGGANRRSDPDAAIPPALQARAEFRQVGNTAGEIRSELEYVYALQRASKPCRMEAAELAGRVKGKNYPWVEGQALLAAASCMGMVGDFGQAPRLAKAAQGVAESAGYPILELRSLGLLAGGYTAVGRAAEAWSAEESGLRTFWGGAFPPERAYQFYYDLGTAAGAEGYCETASSSLRHAVDTIARTNYRSVEGIARQRLAGVASRCGDYAEAGSQFSAANHLFATLPDTPANQFYRMDSEIGLLRLQAERGQAAQALQTLRTMSPRIAEHNSQITVMKYHQTVAEIERQAGELDGGEKEIQEVIATAERVLASADPGSDRLTWSNLMADAYRLLVRIELDRGNTERALEIWEWTRGSAIRPRALDAGFGSAALVRRRSPALTGASVLSFARLGDKLAAWLYDDRGIRFVWLSGDTATRLLASRFADLCSDPHSSAHVLRETGKQLYEAVVAPVAAWLDPQRKLIVEPDGAATIVPFEALPVPGGETMGESFAIQLSPGLYYRQAAESVPVAREGPVLVIGAPVLSPELAAEVPPLPDALREARNVAAQFSHAALLTGADATVPALERALPSARLFHFAGHALYTARQSALLLAQTPGGADYVDASRIAGIRLVPGSLVVLSGCSTGRLRESALNDPDSLVRAFLAAGAGAVVASRWNVDSSATERLMEVFYKSLRQGLPPAQALRMAERELRSRLETSHPYYWSAFTSFGN